MEQGLFTANNVWMMDLYSTRIFYAYWICFFRNRVNNERTTINILFKNIFIITVGLLLYYIGGFNLMYPGFAEGSAGVFEFAGFE